MPYCKNCGAEMLPPVNFCVNCGLPADNSAQPKRISKKVSASILRGAGRFLGWLLWPVFVCIYFIVPLLITQAIISIGVAIGLPFENDVVSVVIFVLVFLGFTFLVVVLCARGVTKDK